MSVEDTIRIVTTNVREGIEDAAEKAKAVVDDVKDNNRDTGRTIEGAQDKANSVIHKANAEAHEVHARASDDIGTKVSETVKAGVDHVKSAIDDAKGDAKLKD